jgi:AcrR family transcriptional regulator
MSGMHASRTLSCANNGAAENKRPDAATMRVVLSIFIFHLPQPIRRIILALIVPKYICNHFCLLRPCRFAAKIGVMANISHKMTARRTAQHADGRRERSRSSRSKIVAALLDLVGKGDVAPSAARVAEVAGVGLRSVFRHFDDMDELYREMGEVIEAQVMPIILQPPSGATWREKLFDIADRRAMVFETILPYRISGNLKRFQSPYLMQDYRRMLRLESDTIESYLPVMVKADVVGTHGLNVILSFQTWRLLRHDQELTVDEAKAVVRRLLGDAMAGMPED